MTHRPYIHGIVQDVFLQCESCRSINVRLWESGRVECFDCGAGNRMIRQKMYEPRDPPEVPEEIKGDSYWRAVQADRAFAAYESPAGAGDAGREDLEKHGEPGAERRHADEHGG